MSICGGRGWPIKERAAQSAEGSGCAPREGRLHRGDFLIAGAGERVGLRELLGGEGAFGRDLVLAGSAVGGVGAAGGISIGMSDTKISGDRGEIVFE